MILVDNQQFWRMMCCSRMVGTLYSSYELHVESARIKVGTFTLTNRRGMEQSLQQIPWEQYISKEDELMLQTVHPFVILNVQTIIKNNMFFPRDVNEMILSSSPLTSLAKSVTTVRSPHRKKVFFLVSLSLVLLRVDSTR